MQLTPKQLEDLALNCSKKDTNVYKELWNASKKAMSNPPQTIIQGIRSVVGKTISKTGDIIDPAKKQSAA